MTLLAAVLFAALFIATALAGPRPRLVWNASASAPIGLYRLSAVSHPAVGMLVVIGPPMSLARFLDERRYLPIGVPLLKHVAARPGARICRFGARVTIDGHVAAVALSRDTRGRLLPRWRGCRTIAPGQLFVLNAAADSMDGRYFGPIPGGARALRPWTPPVHLPSSRELELIDRVEMDRAYLIWHTVPQFHERDAALGLLGDVLGRGRSSRLYKKLVLERQWAQDVTAYQSGRELAGTFGLIATLRPGASMTDVRKLLFDEVEAIATDGVTDEELERVKTIKASAFLFALELMQSTTMLSLQPAALVDKYVRRGLLTRIPAELPHRMPDFGLITLQGEPPGTAVLAFMDVIRSLAEQQADAASSDRVAPTPSPEARGRAAPGH